MPTTWDRLSEELKTEYTMGNTVDLENWYIDETNTEKITTICGR